MANGIERKYRLITIVCIIIALLGRLFSFGLGFIFFLIIIFPIHSLIFAKINSKIVKTFKQSNNYKIGFWISCISFVLAYIFLPDYTNIDSSMDAHAFFGMIMDMNVLNKLHDFALLCFLLNVVSMGVNCLIIMDMKDEGKIN